MSKQSRDKKKAQGTTNARGNGFGGTTIEGGGVSVVAQPVSHPQGKGGKGDKGDKGGKGGKGGGTNG